MKNISRVNIQKVAGSEKQEKEDFLAREEPLEIRLGYEKGGTVHQKSISVTMRTPGNEEELALGFLITEGIIGSISQVKRTFTPVVRHEQAKGNVIVIELQDGLKTDFKKLERHFYTSSSCGVCGKTSIEAVEVNCPFELPENFPLIRSALLHQFPKILQDHQPVFGSTGGLHGAALFNTKGQLLMAKEDIGRHNALDKLIGFSLKKNWLPLSAHLVLLSGRIGFELVQKCAVAGVPILAAVGAPSSLAVQLADEVGMTLIGFLRNGQYNIYTHEERVLF